MSAVVTPSLPTAPLRRIVDRLDEEQFQVLLAAAGYTPGTRSNSGLAHALRRPTISVFLADRIAIALGRHPAAVYGASWWNTVPEASA